MKIIAFISDWGYDSYYVGAAKSVIYGISPKSVVIDITHGITPFNVKEASYIIERVFDDLPERTILLAVVDPGVGTKRKAIAMEIDDKCCVGPNNGIFTRLFNRDVISCYSIENPKYFYKNPPSETFHGRDIFAAAAAHIDNGVFIDKLGPKWLEITSLDYTKPTIENGMISTEVAYIDSFGNLETTITMDDLIQAKITENIFLINGKRVVRAKNYSESAENIILAHFDSSGYLEISSNCGKASEIMKLSPGDRIILERK